MRRHAGHARARESQVRAERSAAAGGVILVARFAAAAVLNYVFGIALAWLLVPAEFGTVAGFDEKGAFDRFAADAASVVHAGLKALDKNRAVVVPGLLNKVAAASTRFVPRSLVRRIAGAIKY